MGKGWKGREPLAPGYIGVDPGSSSGGIGYVMEGGRARAWKLPETERDTWDLINYLSKYAIAAVLEKVHSMPKQGVVGVFKFGMSYGELRMALIAAGIRYTLVPPLKWQTALNCKSGGDKNVTKRKAQELWPSITMTHAKADALLQGEYCRLYAK